MDDFHEKVEIFPKRGMVVRKTDVDEREWGYSENSVVPVSST